MLRVMVAFIATDADGKLANDRLIVTPDPGWKEANCEDAGEQ